MYWIFCIKNWWVINIYIYSNLLTISGRRNEVFFLKKKKLELELAGFDLGKERSQSSSSIDEEFFFLKSILALTLSNIARNWPIYLLKGQEKLPLCLKSFFSLPLFDGRNRSELFIIQNFRSLYHGFGRIISQIRWDVGWGVREKREERKEESHCDWSTEWMFCQELYKVSWRLHAYTLFDLIDLSLISFLSPKRLKHEFLFNYTFFFSLLFFFGGGGSNRQKRLWRSWNVNF